MKMNSPENLIPIEPSEKLLSMDGFMDGTEANEIRKEIQEYSKNNFNDIDQKRLIILNNKLENSISNYKNWTADAFKYALPLYPIKRALSDWKKYGDTAPLDIMISSVGLNTGIGLTTAFFDSLELLLHYNQLIKVRHELRDRQKNLENPLVSTANVVAKLKVQFLNNPIYADILKISNRNTESYIDKEKYNKAQEMGLFVEARHKTINNLITEEMQNLDINQIIEVGTGLSSRSLELSNQFVTYFDTDLKDNIKIREEIKKLDPNSKVKIQELDILDSNQTTEITKSFEQKPFFVVAEGVFTYFTKDQIDKAFLNIKKMLINGGVVIFDIATQKGLEADRSKWSEESRNLLQNFYEISGIKKEDLAFNDLKEVKNYFSKIGFNVKIKSFEGRLNLKDLEKYKNISDEVKNSIVNTPCILVCEIKD